MSQAKWEWLGMAGHLCVSNGCLFHLHTHVNGYCISTVGSFYPDQANRPGYMNTVSTDATHETMAFKLLEGECPGSADDCPDCDHCGDIKGDRYENDRLAEVMHMKMCKKWDSAC